MATRKIIIIKVRYHPTSMFDVVGVVDLRGGLAVRARGGERNRYAPIASVAGQAIPTGDAAALVRAYASRWGISQIYVADLDAIERSEPPSGPLREIAATGAAVWADTGVVSLDDARRALDCGAVRVIVGLETLPALRVLESICRTVGHDRVVFSLDLRHGQPVASSPDIAAQTAEQLVAQAVGAGAGAMIVLDLARVGAGSGPDLDLLARVRAAAPDLPLFAGGGVRDVQDLVHLKNAGYQGALVASALLDGALTRQDLLAIN
jgi:phosphoribosylformimino-5-aminoimidazole carboxamide ribotide isomerase